MRMVWKEVLQIADIQEVEMPAGAEILCAREQREQICVWFLCDPSKYKEKRSIAIVGTGYLAPDGYGRYLGTASLHGGMLMFHIFERR